ncbi:MAG: hypothetical protein ACYDA4_10615 [Ignavibacteriaceae bacterium]
MSTKIIAKVSEGKFGSAKNLLRALKESSNTIDISTIRYGNLGEDRLLSFNLNEESLKLVIESLIANGIIILFPEQFAIKKETRVIVNNQSISQNVEKSDSVKNISIKESPSVLLDFAIKNGDYEIVVQYSKDIRLGHDLLNQAKENIDISIQTSIDHAYNKGIRSTFEVDNALEQLLKIASDKNLKVLNKQEFQKKAGLKAVELCGSNFEQTNNLIGICNNNLLPYIVCLKAAAKLYEILGSNQEKVQEEILYAAKHLNVRWINISLDIMGPEMQEGEFKSVTSLINLIQQKQV